MLTFCCSDEWIFNTLKDFAETFYTFNFSELLANISSGKDSDFEIDLDHEVPTKELITQLKYQMTAMLPVPVTKQQESYCRKEIIF